MEDTESNQRFKKGDIVGLTDEGKKVLGRFLKREKYKILMHSRDSSPRSEIVTITDDNEESRDITASFLRLISRP